MFESKETMKKWASCLLLASLSACGGGGSATGGLTEFTVLPETWTLKGGDGNIYCAVDTSNLPVLTATVVGGTPPYRIVNSSPQWLRVDQTVLTGKNPTFTVTALGGCAEDLGVVVLDNQSRSTTLTFTFEAGDTATTTP